MKKGFTLFLIAAIFLQTLFYVPVYAVEVAAEPNAQWVILNGVRLTHEYYGINGDIYFRLRDLAYGINGSNKQFDIGWDEQLKTATITDGLPYTPDGTERAKRGYTSKTAVPAEARYLIDGKEVKFTAYHINGNDFIKVEDVCKLLDIYIGNFEMMADRIEVIIHANHNYGDEITRAEMYTSIEPKTTHAKIYGTVFREDIKGVAGAVVSLVDANTGRVAQTYTSGVNGGYHFTEVPEGKWYITAVANGFNDFKSKTYAIPEDSLLREGEREIFDNIKMKSITLPKVDKITIKVNDKKGNHIPNAEVSISGYKAKYDEGQKVYIITDIPVGSYTITITPKSGKYYYSQSVVIQEKTKNLTYSLDYP